MAEPGLAGSSQRTTMVLAVVSPKVWLLSGLPRRVDGAGRARAYGRPAAGAFRVRRPHPDLVFRVLQEAGDGGRRGRADMGVRLPVGRPGPAVLHVVVADGRAFVVGAVQLTSMPVVESALAVTSGAAGAAGASVSSSVTVTVTVTSALPLWPSLARTVSTMLGVASWFSPGPT